MCGGATLLLVLASIISGCCSWAGACGLVKLSASKWMCYVINLAIFNCDGIPNADYSEKLNQLVTYVQEQHIAILLETCTNELTRLSSQLHTHTICYHTDVETRGRSEERRVGKEC